MEHKTHITATSPWRYSLLDWTVVLKAVAVEARRDNVTIVAAGVAFFTMLAIFPLITACLSIYGFFADPVMVQEQLASVSSVLPPDAWMVLEGQINAVVTAPNSKLGLGIALGLGISLFSAGAGIRAIMQAMNIAYGEQEKRSFAQLYAIAGSLTLSVTVFLWMSLIVIIGVPAVLEFLRLDGLMAIATRYLPWVVLVALFAFATAIVYRIGPSRRAAKKRWIIPGVIFATLAWLLISAGFSFFVAEFGNYNKVYGSLSAAIILLIWFWLTALVIILGAEINAELERLTLSDTTRGPDRPIGERGAIVADAKPQDVSVPALPRVPNSPSAPPPKR